MPGPDEIRRFQEEHPVSDEIRKLVESVPPLPFNPQVMRRRLIEKFTDRALGTPWEEPEKK
jgi:hypothetical protein